MSSSIVRRVCGGCEDGGVAIFRRRRPANTLKLLSAGDRFETVVDGIATRHLFSAGAHYDPERIAFGALTGLDEHAVQPGAGFDWHAHRGVEIVSWVLDGTLRHEDDASRVELVGPGELLHQSTGSGVRHREWNASDSEPLRFVQLTVLGASGEPRCSRATPPLLVPGAGLVDVLTGKTELELSSALLYVTRGSFNVTGMVLGPGDAVQLNKTLQVSGGGELLVWTAGHHHDEPKEN
jgi:mannose-6-phosphate isomerase-like protein (cupin superfamily)